MSVSDARRNLAQHTGSCNEKQPFELAERAFDILAKRNRSWKRLSPLVDLALNSDLPLRTISDIGTDHGLLAAAFALSGRFKKVIGVDKSKQALEDGAYKLQVEIMNYYRQRKTIEQILPLTFRCGDGLKALEGEKVDATCIAGMGANTMVGILQQSSRKGGLLLDELDCQELVLQPTNSRPRNLMLLYSSIENLGFRVSAERITYLSSRWYLSTSFTRTEGHTAVGELPFAKLASSKQSDPIFIGYLKHHCSWLRQDMKKGKLRGGEDEWLQAFESILKERETM